jgi:hypothetical protein
LNAIEKGLTKYLKMGRRTPQRMFTKEEDAVLEELVGENGNSWPDIARTLGGRSGRECRDRWQVLAGLIQVEPQQRLRRRRKWEIEEDCMLLDMVRTFGEKWDQIAAVFYGRTATQLRSRWNSRFNRPFLRREWRLPNPEEQKIVLTEPIFDLSPEEFVMQLEMIEARVEER